MRAASDIAAWWDEQHRRSEAILDEFIDEHPNWFGVVVAGTAATTMRLGAGLVDVLRLGEGMAQGGISGVAKDGLRLLQFAPAIGKLSQSVLARVVVDPGGGICTWVSATKALRQVGTKAFAKVEDLAAAAGYASIKHLGAAFVDAIVPALQKLGARVTHLGSPTSMAAVDAAVQRQGVVLFSVTWQGVGHTLYAFRDAMGRICYADRTGRVIRALKELDNMYPGIGAAKVYGTAILVEGPRILIADGLAILGMEVRAQLAVDPETAAQTLEVKRAHSGPSSNRPVQQHTVQAGDSLQGIARRYYGLLQKWPVILEANRAVIGRNPHLLKPGSQLNIPTLPLVSAVSR
jgi:hypothetical protein